MQGFIFEKSFHKAILYLTEYWVGLITKEPSVNATRLLIHSSSRHNYRTPSQNNSHHENIPPKSLVVWPNRNSPNTVDTAIRIGFF